MFLPILKVFYGMSPVGLMLAFLLPTSPWYFLLAEIFPINLFEI